jgi:hypothetical protein
MFELCIFFAHVLYGLSLTLIALVVVWVIPAAAVEAYNQFIEFFSESRSERKRRWQEDEELFKKWVIDYRNEPLNSLRDNNDYVPQHCAA